MHYFDIDISHSAHNHQNDPWDIAEKMRGIVTEDECNDTYGCYWIHQIRKLKYLDEEIPSRNRKLYKLLEQTV